MNRGTGVVSISVVGAMCCFALPFFPEVRDWVFYGSTGWVVPVGLLAGIAWTIWSRG